MMAAACADCVLAGESVLAAGQIRTVIRRNHVI